MNENLFSQIQITTTKPSSTSGGPVAYGSCVVAGVVRVNFKIINGTSGLFVTLPSHKGQPKEGPARWYHDVSFPDDEVRDKFQNTIMEIYKKRGE